MSFAEPDRNRSPGVHVEFVPPESKVEFQTGVPAFVGFGKLTDAAEKTGNKHWCRITSWQQFKESVKPSENSFLAYAVRGFFENDGKSCVIVPLTGDKHAAKMLAAPFIDSNEAIQFVDIPCAKAGLL